MTQKSKTNNCERLDPLGEVRPSFREHVVSNNDPIRARRPTLRWVCLLFSGLLSFAPILPSHRVLGVLEPGAFATQAQVSPHAEASVTPQGILATTEGSTFSLRISSRQGAEFVEAEQPDAPTEEGTDPHGATDDDGDDDED